MRRFLSTLVLTAICSLAGCSKDDGGSASAPAPEVVSAPFATGGTHPAVAPVPVADISQAIKSGQYDRAVDQLNQSAAGVTKMTEAQRLQYEQARQEAAAALLQSQDPAAKAAYERLSRSATRR